jgi:hypothetical protein
MGFEQSGALFLLKVLVKMISDFMMKSENH